jgi:amino acid permease
MAMVQQQETSGAQEHSIVCDDNEATEQLGFEDLNSHNSFGVSDDEERHGTTASARFNMLSTMVGGGSLSLPLAFQKSGNALLAPLLLIIVAGLTEFCFRVHVGSARLLSPSGFSSQTRPGHDSFESVTAQAFGKHMHILSMALVTAMCFFGTVGYAVLLRDMLQPITNWVWHGGGNDGVGSGPSWQNNLAMLTVVLAVTPLCTLKTLTSLQRFGAASMFSVLILGSCVFYRSVQCKLGLLFMNDELSNDRKTFQVRET